MNVGDKVKVLSGHWASGQQGQVTAVDGDQVTVRLGGDFPMEAVLPPSGLFVLPEGHEQRQRRDEE